MTVTITVELDEATSAQVRKRTGKHGAYNTAEQYLIALIEEDYERRHAEFEVVKAELKAAFEAPEDGYIRVTARDVIDRNRSKRSRAA